MTFEEAITRWVLLGDALTLSLPTRTAAALLLLRLRYSKAVREFESLRDDARQSATPSDDPAALLKDILGRPCEVQADALGTEAFEDIVGAAMAKGSMRTHVITDAKGEPTEIPAMAWLERLVLLTAEN